MSHGPWRSVGRFAGRAPESGCENMSQPDDIERCDFCKSGRINKRNEQIAFHQWTDKGYVFCRTNIPMRVCERCGAKSWDQAAEAIVNEVVRAEYRKLP
jgi:hypothetical protein